MNLSIAFSHDGRAISEDPLKEEPGHPVSSASQLTSFSEHLLLLLNQDLIDKPDHSAAPTGWCSRPQDRDEHL